MADHREIRDGPFDKIVSIGMYEHVGRLELDNYARTVHGLLRPGGLFLNHGIARLYSETPHGDTFISRYIFPDGELHPVAEFVTSMQTAGLEVRDIESLREHYPLTLRRWAANLQAHHAEAIASAGHERESVEALHARLRSSLRRRRDHGLPDPGDQRGGATRPPATTVHSAQPMIPLD